MIDFILTTLAVLGLGGIVLLIVAWVIFIIFAAGAVNLVRDCVRFVIHELPGHVKRLYLQLHELHEKGLLGITLGVGALGLVVAAILLSVVYTTIRSRFG